MGALDDTSLKPPERHVVEQLGHALSDEFGERFVGLWLFGSTARGEQRGELSDVDLLVIVDDPATFADQQAAHGRAWNLALAADAEPYAFSVQVRDRAWLAGRRAIDAFFIQEIDRDRVIVAGEAA